MVTLRLLPLSALFLLGCQNRGDIPTVGIAEGEVLCDDTASELDDLFTFDIITYGEVDLVQVIADPVSGLDRLFYLDEIRPNTWYGEAWGDELNMSCDEMDRVEFAISASSMYGTAVVLYP